MHEAYGITSAIVDGLPAASTTRLGSVYTKGTTTLPSGQRDPNATPVLLASHGDLECRVGPMIDIRPTDKIERREKVERSRIERHVMMRGYYPLILVDMLFVVDSITYRIVGVNHDSNHILTRLHVELITV
jgi:hypothetical protein